MTNNMEDSPMEETKQICTNCRYFVQHYRKSHAVFRRVYCGACEKRKLTPKEKRKFPSIVDCPEWEPMEIQLNERRQNIAYTLHDLDERLKIISEILLDDEAIRKELND